ncbi:redoxin domain-containing protein [bacterium]|nr:redoxin domain-containing protein [bacterium]
MNRVLATILTLTFAGQGVLATETPVGKKIENFKLPDQRGAEHSLDEFKRSAVVVIAFIGTECPLAKIYGPRLAELSEKFKSRGVSFIAIDSNRQDTLKELSGYVLSSGITFPVLKDNNNAVADQMEAVRTPEVFVLNKDRVVTYWGRIDDRYGIGYAHEKVNNDYLRQAIEQTLINQPVKTPSVEPVGCLIGRSHKSDDASTVTYSDQVARILQKRCVECHRAGEIAPFALTEYSEVAGWADTIVEVIKDQRMPPWHANPEFGHFRNDRTMPEEEKEIIYEWVKAGAPEGDSKKLPKQEKYLVGWTLPRKPDLVLDIQKTPFTVAADGVVAYQRFTVDPGFTEGKWIEASQIVPGAAPVVHHVLCFVVPPGKRAMALDENGLGFLAAYVPGYRAAPYPKGMAKYVPAGSKLEFQMHYTPAGKMMRDQSKIGFVFAKPNTITHMVQTISAGSRGFSIPPHAEDYKAEGMLPTYADDLTLLAFSPHMHLRGKAFTYEAIYPDGKKETLLDIPRYDFNWQTNYELVKPKVLPSGTRVNCVAHWDNSKNNPANPDPSIKVEWGEQTWEEMMLGFMDVAIPVDKKKLARGEVPRLRSSATTKERATDLLTEFDKNGDKKLTADEVPEKVKQFFPVVDQNHDGVVDAKEAADFVKMMPGELGGTKKEETRGSGRGTKKRPTNSRRGSSKS